MQQANGILRLIFLMTMAFVLHTFIYFSFANIYSSEILNFQNFEDQFQSGVYQYRILSGYLFLWIYDFLSTLNVDYSIFKLKFLKADSEPQVFLAFYILNTLFFVATAMVFHYVLQLRQLIATASEKLLIGVVGLFTIAITQFVIVPYDVSSYFFLLLFFYVFVQYIEDRSAIKLVFLSILILISTFNRETAALSISLAATLLYLKSGISRRSILPLVPMIITFLAVYFGVRLLSVSFNTNDGNLFLQNFTEPKNWLGILFWAVFFTFTMMLSKCKTSRKSILVFHLFSIPYVLMCFYTGILYEVRLYVPLFLCSLLLSKLEITDLKSSPNNLDKKNWK